MLEVDSITNFNKDFGLSLKKLEIDSTEDFLERANCPHGLSEISEFSGVKESTIKKWAQRIDLVRVPGVRIETAELLEACGVFTVTELKRRNPKRLYKKLSQINEKKKISKSIPSLKVLKNMIEEAMILQQYDFH